MSHWILCDCPHCGNTLRIDATTADEWTQCPACRRHSRIPDLLALHLEASGAEATEPGGRESGFAWAGTGFSPVSRERETVAEEFPVYEDLPDVETQPEALEEAFHIDSGTFSGYAGEGEGQVEDAESTEPQEEPLEFDYSTLDEEQLADDAKPKREKTRKRRFGLFGETPEWEDEDPRFRGRDLAGKRVIATGVGIVVVGAALLGVVMFHSGGRTGGEASEGGNGLPPIVLPTDGAPMSMEEAKEKLNLALQTRPLETIAIIKPTIEAFLNATDLEQRIKTVREPERLRPVMEEYYQSHTDGPISFLRVDDQQETVDYRGNLLVLPVLMRDYSKKQIAIEYTGAGFLIDWESFVGYGEMPVERFREEIPYRPVMMRVSFGPAVPPYFNYGFTDEENLECHLLTFPDESYVFGYTLKFSPISNRLREFRGSAPSCMAVLSLRYPEGAKVGDQVWIEDMIAEGWILHEATRANKP
ncbi:MAG: hypothetical protein ACKO2G_10325 [Verrucomicrobiales bacterium]